MLKGPNPYAVLRWFYFFTWRTQRVLKRKAETIVLTLIIGLAVWWLVTVGEIGLLGDLMESVIEKVKDLTERLGEVNKGRTERHIPKVLRRCNWHRVLTIWEQRGIEYLSTFGMSDESTHKHPFPNEGIMQVRRMENERDKMMCLLSDFLRFQIFEVQQKLGRLGSTLWYTL